MKLPKEGSLLTLIIKMCMPSDKTKRAFQYFSKFAVVASITGVMALLEVRGGWQGSSPGCNGPACHGLAFAA